jgi:hypothetical protein
MDSDPDTEFFKLELVTQVKMSLHNIFRTYLALSWKDTFDSTNLLFETLVLRT